VVLIAVVPGVVGTSKTGTVPTVLLIVVEEGSVDGMVPALMTAPRLGLRLDVLARVTVRRVEATVPKVTTPADAPRNAVFAAARLLGASEWTLKLEPDVPAPADDPPCDSV
jgi:hypothetical protein